MDHPDIRRTIKTKRAFTGQEIANALICTLRQVSAIYVQKLVLDIDGDQTFNIGLSSECPYADVIVRTGDNLAFTGIRLKDSYTQIGIGSTEWPGEKYALGYDNKQVIAAVEEARFNLENLLDQM